MPELEAAAPPAGARRLFLLGLVGPVFLICAAICAALAGGDHDLPLGAYVLRLLDRDLSGLAVVFAVAGAACMLTLAWAHRRLKSKQRPTSGWRFAAVAAAVFALLFVPVLVVWPSPPIRLAFVPADKGAPAVYRFYVRGLKHGPYPLEAYGPPVLLASAGAPGGVVTCDVFRSVSFGPFGWARDLDARWSDPNRTQSGTAVADAPGICRPGIDLSSVSADARARDLLMPFVYGDRLSFTPEQVEAAAGSSTNADALDGMGLYLQFKRSPARAGSKYEPADHAYAVYRCDAAYAQFLESKGVLASAAMVRLLRRIRNGYPDVALDARSWRGRVDPMTTLAGGSDLVPLSEPVASPACLAMLAHYAPDDAGRAAAPDLPQIVMPARPPVRPSRRP